MLIVAEEILFYKIFHNEKKQPCYFKNKLNKVFDMKINFENPIYFKTRNFKSILIGLLTSLADLS